MKSSNNKILLDQVEDLYNNLNYANWSVLLISSFMVWILWPVAVHDHLMLWDAYILAIVLMRESIAIRYRKAVVTEKTVNTWLKLYITGVFLSGIGWGAALIFVVPSNMFIYLVTTSFLICGLVTGSAASLASLKYGFAMFSVPAILPGALYLMAIGSRNSFTVGISLLVFLVFILFIALRIHKTIYYSLKRQVEVGSKLSVLEMEKSELEAKVEKLKDEVEFERKEIEKMAALLNPRQSNAKVSRIGNLRDEKFINLLESLKGGVWEMNVQTGHVNFSQGWLNLLGYTNNGVNRNIDFWESVLHPDDKLEVLNSLHAFLDGKENEFYSTHRLKTQSGEWMWVMSRAHGVILGNFGEVLNAVGIDVYLPEGSRSVDKSSGQSGFDLSAGVYSASDFNKRMQHLIKTASVEGIEHSLCYLKIMQISDQKDMDPSLKEIIIYEVGKLLQKDFRQGDSIFHLGDESFAMLMEFCNIEDAWEKAFSLKTSISKLHLKFNGFRQRVTVAIGITPISNSYSIASELMQDAEKACELAYTETSNLIYVYQKDNEDIGANLFEKYVAKKIRECIANNDIVISANSLKPKQIEVGQQSVYAVNFKLKEAMNETFPGADYYAIARKNYLSPSLDTFVIRNLFAWLSARVAEDANKNAIYIYECLDNSYLDERFMDFVIEEFESHPAINGSVCFGVSEKYYSDNPESLRAFVGKLKSAGSKIALTDVGSTSLTTQFLQEFSVDFLKIDKSLMRNLDKDKSSYLTVKYIIDISHLAGMKSIVVDVDDSLLLEALDTIDIDYVHGSIVASPELLIK